MNYFFFCKRQVLKLVPCLKHEEVVTGKLKRYNYGMILMIIKYEAILTKQKKNEFAIQY